MEFKPVEELSFRQAMQELEGIVALLEGSTLELEDSLVSYERGIVLLRHLKSRLSQAEQRVDVLMGELAASPEDKIRDATLS